MNKVGVIDYQMGNLRSVMNAIEYIGVSVGLIHSVDDLSEYSHIILPGVGSFRVGMEHLKRQGLTSELVQHVEETKKPFLGICLGMQLLAEKGTEGGDSQGLGFIQGEVVKFQLPDLHVPHIGWNTVKSVSGSNLLGNQDEDYYFVHSYYFNVSNKENIIGTCNYGIEFPSVVQNSNVFGAQFHPEKSHQAGLRLLRNFIKGEA